MHSSLAQILDSMITTVANLFGVSIETATIIGICLVVLHFMVHELPIILIAVYTFVKICFKKEKSIQAKCCDCHKE